MTSQVMTATPSQKVDHVRKVMKEHGIHSMPVVNPEGEPLGIVSATDLLEAASGAPISSVMSRKVWVCNAYDGPHIAARIMRKHHIHRLVVTHEKRVVGILSSFDLMQLIEDHRFSIKGAPTESRNKRVKKGIVDMS